MINPNVRAKDRIYSELPEELKALMKKYILSEDEHNLILQDIKKQSYANKKPVSNPTFYIVTGQTGSGKSNLTSYLYSKEENVVVIDSDKYKAYRPDSQEILDEHLAEYAFLTAPDSYLHRDEMIVDAIKSKYNILMECATSEKEGLFVNTEILKKAGYNVEIHALGVSSLNSVMSAHERYEALLEINDNAAKLTSIERHDDSYNSLGKAIMEEQRKKGVKINVYKRGDKRPFIPEEIYNQTDKKGRYSCPYEALIDAQAQDLQKTLPTFEKRYNVLVNQMEIRKAPQKQIEQLKKMSNLDFSQKYQVTNARDEINDLGRSINTMSDKLERTIKQLRSSNIELERDIEEKSKIDEMRKTFISDVSHELKTPIALIQGYSEGLLENVNSDEESRKFYAEVILDETNKMDKLVKQLLELMKLEYGKREFHNKEFNIVELEKEVIRKTNVMIEEKQAEIKFDDSQEIQVFADDFYIEQVLTNYLTNAIKNVKEMYGEKYNKVFLSCTKQKRCLPATANTAKER